MPPSRFPIPLRFTRSRDLVRREESRAWRAMFWALGCVIGSATAMVAPWLGDGFYHASGSGDSSSPCSVFLEDGKDIDELSLASDMPSAPPAVPAMPVPETRIEPNTPEPVVALQELPDFPADTLLAQENTLTADIMVDMPAPFALAPRAQRATRPKPQAASAQAAAAPSVRRASGNGRMQAVAEGDSASEDHIRVSYLSAPKPPYPVSLRMARSEGSVGVRIAVDASGKPTQVAVVRSSGFSEMDNIARNWILAHWLFRPEKRGGRAVASVVTTSIHFEID